MLYLCCNAYYYLPNLFVLLLNLAGYLILDRKCSEDIAKLLIECIYSHVDQSNLLTNESQPDAEDSSDGAAIKSICLSINKRLRKCPSPPLPDNVLMIVLALFLKLGMSSVILARTSPAFDWSNHLRESFEFQVVVTLTLKTLFCFNVVFLCIKQPVPLFLSPVYILKNAFSVQILHIMLQKGTSKTVPK